MPPLAVRRPVNVLAPVTPSVVDTVAAPVTARVPVTFAPALAVRRPDTPNVLETVAAPVTASVPVMFAPPVVTVKPLLAVNRPLEVSVPVKVFAPTKLWVVVSTRPALLVLADCRNKVEPTMLAPVALALPPFRVPMLLTPLPPVEAGTQLLEPFQTKTAVLPAVMFTPYIVNGTLPVRLLT